MYLAFYTEWMARQKELGPASLNALLRSKAHTQTGQDMTQALLHIADIYGLKVKVTRKGQA